jgi:hypothetical protein
VLHAKFDCLSLEGFVIQPQWTRVTAQKPPVVMSLNRKKPPIPIMR